MTDWTPIAIAAGCGIVSFAAAFGGVRAALNGLNRSLAQHWAEIMLLREKTNEHANAIATLKAVAEYDHTPTQRPREPA